jgi:glycosyltransferase involved in cell wall biosynthesis
MRIAFYAPLKSPTHGTPSGDRRVAGLLMEALGHAGESVQLVSTFRSFDGTGDGERQAALRAQGEGYARKLVDGWRGGPAEARPQLWFTYHLYYKAPDWLGPLVSAELGIPYVVAEASYAAKRAAGPWALGHQAVEAAIRRASLIFSPSRDDLAGLAPLVPAERVLMLPPFLDAAPYRAAAAKRDAHRAKLAAAHGLDPAVPWIIVIAMMREGDKLASYRALAQSLAQLADLPWRLVVAGDGPARDAVHGALDAAAPGRATYLGTLAQRHLAEALAASDLTAWPAVNEAYGMALLEAQAAGLPVVSCALRGVPDVVMHERTGLLVPPNDPGALAAALRALLADPARRRALGAGAVEFVLAERGVEVAGRKLSGELHRLIGE